MSVIPALCFVHARQPQRLAVEPRFAGVGQVDAAQDLHQRRLAGAIFANDAQDFARAQREMHVVQGLNAWEGFGDVSCFKEWCAG